MWSGTVVTAGDVAFYGTMDRWFKALDARSGELLWQFRTGSGIIGQPISFKGPDGKQYVAILSGVGGWAGAAALGLLPEEDPAIALGFTGPMLRGSGIEWDLRKKQPYEVYDRMDFDIPVGVNGDTYDRYLVRMEEIRQSLRIIDQALQKLPPGPVLVDDKRVALPPKSDVYSNIEALMNHFKLVYEGILAPPGEVYGYTEAANGELGYYIVSDGRKYPWRVKVRWQGMTGRFISALLSPKPTTSTPASRYVRGRLIVAPWPACRARAERRSGRCRRSRPGRRTPWGRRSRRPAHRH